MKVLLTADDVRRLIDGGEAFSVEFKGEEDTPLSDNDLVAAVVCLANGDGGYLLVGIEDDGRVTGARPRHVAGKTDPNRVAALIANRTQPPVRADVQQIEVDGKPVLVIRVEDEPRVVGTTDGRFLRRALGGDGRPSCVPYLAHEMLAHEIDRGASDYSALTVREASWDDLDPLEFERFRRLVREAGAGADSALLGLSDLDIAKALGVVGANHEPRDIRAGAVLFGKQEALRRFVPTHEVAFQVLRGTAVETNEFTRWPLFRAAEELMARFAARNKEEELEVGLLRVPVPEFPEVSFREGVANALVHRDYTRIGAIHVQWHDDRLEISSPGGFPPGITLTNFLVAPPRPRSPILADAFKRAGLVERTGRGIGRIFEGQLRIGRQPPDYSRSTADDVVLVLPGGPANLAMVRYVAGQARAAQGPLALEDLIVVSSLLRERQLTTARAAAILQRGEPEARAVLNRLVERGVLQARGQTRGRSYHLSPGAYRALGQGVGYVRARGFEPAQQEQMVLTHVAAHGRITRSEAAELCQITPRQATALLKKLASRGDLILRGARRGAYYERPP